MLNIHFVIYCQFGLQSDFMISLLLYSLQQNLTLRELIKCVCVCVHAYTNKYMPTLAFRLSRERPTGLHLHIQVTCLICGGYALRVLHIRKNVYTQTTPWRTQNCLHMSSPTFRSWHIEWVLPAAAQVRQRAY